MLVLVGESLMFDPNKTGTFQTYNPSNKATLAFWLIFMIALCIFLAYCIS
jgi:uncharacterized protein with PQ loop repeat